MTLETSVASLTTATTALTSAVNVQKSILDTSVTTATTQAALAKTAADAVGTKLGYSVPVAYAAGISITLATQTVSNAGTVYAPNLVDLPFTTTGTFETSKFRVIQGVTAGDLAAPFGSGLSGHNATLNYVMGSLGGAINDTVVNVKMFPWLAKGDGVTDDRAAIQAALTATRGKAVLLFPPGNFICSGSLTVGQGSHIRGSNGSATDWRRNAASLTRLTFTSATVGTNGITVDQADLFSSYVWNVSINSLSLIGVNAVGSFGINLLSVANANLKNVSCSNFGVGLVVNYGMFGTYKNVNLSGCLTTSLLIAGTNGTTTTQSFTECIFRESPWGITIESTATGQSFGNSFHGCTIESTTVGGANVHRTCDAAFNDMYCENVFGTLFRIGLDGFANTTDYSNISFKGGVLAGRNGGFLSDTVIDIGNVNQVTVDGTILQRAVNGIRCDVTTRANSVFVAGIGFVQVTNLLVNSDWKLQGSYPSAVLSAPRFTTTKANKVAAWQSGAVHDLFTGRSEAINVGVAMGIDATNVSASVTATHASGGSAPLVFRTTFNGAEGEAARLSIFRYFKATGNGSYNVPSFSTNANSVAHQFVQDAAGDTSPALLVSNLSVNASSHALITTKPNITQGTHLRACRTDTGAAVLEVAANGNVSNVNNIYAALSDVKLKQDIVDTGPKLADLLQVRVVNYALKSDPTHRQLGVIAQELEAVFPGLVDAAPDMQQVARTRLVEVPARLDEAGLELEPAGQTREDYFETVDLGTVTKSVKYSLFVPMLIKAMQEQQAMIDLLSKQVAELSK